MTTNDYEQRAHINALADRFYELNRGILGKAHEVGIITDMEYKQCLARGKEFSPVGWIAEYESSDLQH